QQATHHLTLLDALPIYFRGWPKESVVSYYDLERTKMKEITPIEFGEKDGYYFRFFENGQIAIMGEYQWDQKIGDWTEYYPNRRRSEEHTSELQSREDLV